MTTSLSLTEEARRPFLDCADKLSGALVYLDEGAAEVCHYAVGLPLFLGLGAVAVCALHTASPEVRPIYVIIYRSFYTFFDV